MAFQIIWSPQAETDFDRVIEYLFENWTEKEISFFVNETNKVIAMISKYPYIFRGSEKENVIEAVITKHNLLIYEIHIEIKTINLLTFFDTRQDPKKK